MILSTNLLLGVKHETGVSLPLSDQGVIRSVSLLIAKPVDFMHRIVFVCHISQLNFAEG